MAGVEDFRKFLLNGIAWSAGLEVPEGGVQSTAPVENEAPPTPAAPVSKP
jgi:hypothetical protein